MFVHDLEMCSSLDPEKCWYHFRGEGSLIFNFFTLICAVYYFDLFPLSFRTMENNLECFKISLSSPSQHLCLVNGF